VSRGFFSTLGVGTTDRVSTGSFTPGSIQTVAFWYNRRGAGGNSLGRVFASDTANGDHQLYFSSPNMRFQRNYSTTSGQWEWSAQSSASTGVWVHTVMMWDSNSTAAPTVYINGVAASVTTNQSPSGTPTATTVSKWHIGNNQTTNRGWDGLIEDFACWNGRLTKAQAVALFKGTPPCQIRPDIFQEWVPMKAAQGNVRGFRMPCTTIGTKKNIDRLRVANDHGFGPMLAAVAAASGITGEASVTVGGITASATGALAIAGTTSASIGTVAISAAGTAAIAGSATASIGSVALSGAGALALTGQSSASLGAVSLSASGVLAIGGALSGSIGAVGLSGAGQLALAGGLAAPIGAIGLAAEGGQNLTGSLAQGIGTISLSSAGTIPIDGHAAATLGAITVSGAGSLPVAGGAAITLDPVTASAVGVLPISAEAAAAIGIVTLAAAGQSVSPYLPSATRTTRAFGGRATAAGGSRLTRARRL
jgi:hypothetical protein